MTLNQEPALEPIAIVGIGCRLAGDVNTPAAFWRLLLAGGSAVGEVPAERWDPYLRRDPRNAAILKATTRKGSFLSDLPGFDAEFFGVSPREAELMDPQQRLALEVSWEALEDAGVPPRALAGSDTAVLMGVNSDDYGKLVMEDLPGIEAWTGIGTALCGVANRVSHLLDLRGPSVALDAACAASLVAVHLACQLLRAGETSLALAGGVSALIGPGLTRVLDVAGATAPDGRCKSFDESADGYGRGEGAAVVVLKRLADAQRDNDRVLAVVRGGAVAQDGRTVGIMSPNGEAQEQMFLLTCRTAGIDPTSIGFVEAHGTGTPTGDPVELTALSAVYGAGRPANQPCLVGSAKPNTGHLEGGAGVVGLMKAALALHHEAIPPTAGVQNPTTAVDWSTNGLRVNTEAQTWPRTGQPRRAAVCSYGYGGTIAHVLLEEAPARPAAESPKPPSYQVVPVSGRSQSRLSSNAEALGDHLRSAHDLLTDIAGTLWSRRSHEPVRAAIIAEDHTELMVGLDALANGDRNPSVATGSVLPGAAAGAVWVCSGHGSHWVGMGAELLREEPAFAAVIDAIDPVFAAELGFSAREALSSGEHGGTDQVQALTFAMQVGLAAVLGSRGAAPAAVIGHSVGEVAACVIAGVFDLTQGAKVACYRARGFRSVQGKGAMALVALSFAEAEQRLAGQTAVVAAVSASPQSTVISGPADEVHATAADWSAQGVVTRAVNTDVAFHSPAMDDLTAELARLTGALSPLLPTIPLYSTAMTDPRSTALRGPEYWVANLRGRVRFTEAVTAAAADGHRLFLEIAAHPVVSHSIVDTLSHAGVDDYAVLPVQRRNMPEVRSITTAVAALHCHGAPVALRPSHPQWAHDLPGTQWQHRRFWRTPAPPPGGGAVHDPETNTLLGGRLEVTAVVPAKVWQTRLDMDTRPYPGDHPVGGTEIIPAAVLLNTFLTATGGDLADVRLRTPVAPGRVRAVQVVLQDRALSLASRIEDDDSHTDSDSGGWLTHCTAGAAVAAGLPSDRELDIEAVRARCTEELQPGHVADTLADLGVAAMGFPWEITELRRGDGELLAAVRAEPDGSAPATWAPLLDAATSAASIVFDSPLRLRMPARIDRVQLHGAPVASAILHIRRGTGTLADVTIADADGTVVGAISGMYFDQLENPGGNDVSRMMHQLAWHPTSWGTGTRPSQVILVGGDAQTRAWCMRDLAAADVDQRLCKTPEEIPATLPPGAVVLVLPRPEDAPVDTVRVVHQALTALLERAAHAQLWALTRGVYEGSDISGSPLWGFARVAAAEHPGLWGGVVDVADDNLPIGVLASLGGHGVVVVRDDIALTARLTHAESGRRASLTCSPAGTYLITGGTGALGVRVAARLADLGARRIVLLSRSGIAADRASWDAGQEPIRTILSLEERGVSVRVAAVDIAAPGAADGLRAALHDLPPVRGVVHAAGVEAGALLAGTTAGDFAEAMRPKVDGALTLHEVFPPGELDWLVLFSSCGYLAGFPGQGAYACANAFLDAFAQHRRSLGDRTTAVAWTAWRGLGMGSASSFVAAQLGALGMGTVGADDAMRALDLAVRADQAHIVVLPVTADAASVPMLADIAPQGDQEANGAGLGGLQLPIGRDGVDTEARVAELVVATVAAELGLPDGGVDPRLPLAEIGVDSIMTVALRRQLERKTGLTLPPTLLWEHPTAAAVTTRIVELLRVGDFGVTCCAGRSKSRRNRSVPE